MKPLIYDTLKWINFSSIPTTKVTNCYCWRFYADQWQRWWQYCGEWWNLERKFKTWGRLWAESAVGNNDIWRFFSKRNHLNFKFVSLLIFQHFSSLHEIAVESSILVFSEISHHWTNINFSWSHKTVLTCLAVVSHKEITPGSKSINKNI